MAEDRPGPTLTRVKLMVAVAAAVLVALAVVLSVTSSSASACGSCHAMAPYRASLQASAHKDVGCYRCHAPSAWDLPGQKASELFRMYPAAFLGQQSVTGPGVTVPREACVACHEAVLTGVANVNGLRIRHGVCAAGPAPCDSCHGSTAHGTATRFVRTYVMEDCVVCHQKDGGPTKCDSCHAGRRETQRLAVGPWQVTHGPDWRQTHGAGTIRYCVTCHPQDYCVQCHGVALPHPAVFPATHGRTAAKAGASCHTCHDKVRFCDACHGLPMPHPAGFLPEHSKVATSAGDEGCLTCHVRTDCDACHVKHVHPAVMGLNGTPTVPPTQGAGRP